RAGLDRRDYNQTAVVSANVGNSLPAVGAVVGGPQVAAAMLVLSTPYVSHTLYASLHQHPALPSSGALPPADAIVLLGGGTVLNQPEWGGDRPSTSSVARAHYAVALSRRTGAPVLVTGGNPRGGAISEAHAISDLIERELGGAVRWREAGSNDTWQNAMLTKAELGPIGLMRIYLVTDSFHMRRAVRAFEGHGFDVVPAPTRLRAPP
ncbi:MAG: ElyC/SanA/YdcF family protein, partial [Actinomycetota bacterium]